VATITPYDSAAGKRYRVRYRKPDHSQTDKRGFKTKREAELFAATVEVSKASGEYIDPTAGRTTVDALAAVWLPNQAHLKASSFRPVEIAWRVHVKPTWGKRPLNTISHSEVQTWVSQLGAGKSATTVLRAFGVLASILDVAVRDRKLPSNPARGVDLPTKGKKRRAYLKHDQVEALAKESGDNATLVYVLAYMGVRWGEATGARVRALNRTRRRITIEENAVSVGSDVVVGTTKSDKVRAVPYPAFLESDLLALCEGKPQDGLIFGDGVHHQRLPHSVRGWFTYAVKRCMAADPTFPRITPHDLRHTAASFAVSAGANVKVLQNMLGHASAAMTLDIYSDLFDEDLEAVGVALDQARTRALVGK
jgi:integrase